MLGGQLDPGPVRFGIQHVFQPRVLLTYDESARIFLSTSYAEAAVDAPLEGAPSTDHASLSGSDDKGDSLKEMYDINGITYAFCVSRCPLFLSLHEIILIHFSSGVPLRSRAGRCPGRGRGVLMGWSDRSSTTAMVSSCSDTS